MLRDKLLSVIVVFFNCEIKMQVMSDKADEAVS